MGWAFGREELEVKRQRQKGKEEDRMEDQERVGKENCWKRLRMGELREKWIGWTLEWRGTSGERTEKGKGREGLVREKETV